MDAVKPICHHVVDTCHVKSQQLWDNHKDNLTEDILQHAQVQNPNLEQDYSDAIFNQALIIIEDKIKALGGSDLKTFGLPDPQRH